MAKKKQTQTAERAAEHTAVIEVPLGDVGETEYLSRHVESRLKTREQQLAMKRLLRGRRQRTDDSPQDALRQGQTTKPQA